MPGRRPKTSAERQADGNPGHRALPNDPEPESGWPERPTDLGAIARRQYRLLGELLEAEGRLTKSDGPALEGGARFYEMWILAGRRARSASSPKNQKKRAAVTNPDGTKRIDIEVLVSLLDDARSARTEERMAGDAYRKWLNDNCLSAGTRARARVSKTDDETPNLLSRLRAQASGLRRVK
jgi:phage terminase small subunit